MKKVLLSFVATLIVVVTFAQVQEATITVQSIGSTEEEATHQALKSAIEQTFGTFVSANTTILNDELVRDDIISISNGNIKHYDKVSVISMPDGNIVVTVKATVSVNKLISYAKSKGSRAEFEGQSYAANVKYMKLRAKNAEELLRSTADQIDILAKDMFDFSLNLGEPRKDTRYQAEGKKYNWNNDNSVEMERTEEVYAFPASVILNSNMATHNVFKLIKEVLNAISITGEEHRMFENAGIPTEYAGRWAEGGLIIESGNRYISVSEDIIGDFQTKIALSIVNSVLGFKIIEIGNPQNIFLFTGEKPQYFSLIYNKKYLGHDIRYAGNDVLFYDTDKLWFTSLQRNSTVGYNYMSLTPNFNITLAQKEGKYIQSAIVVEGYRMLGLSFWNNYELEEIKVPIQFTRKQERLIDRGKYNGPWYTIKYGESKPIYKIPITLLIPEDRMETFQGFEIQRYTRNFKVTSR